MRQEPLQQFYISAGESLPAPIVLVEALKVEAVTILYNYSILLPVAVLYSSCNTPHDQYWRGMTANVDAPLSFNRKHQLLTC